jgi:hypothetical protein
MKAINRILIAVAAVTVITAVPAFAWDSFGHMEVACVAYQQLTPQIQQRATALLKLNPNYTTWSGWVPSSASAIDKDMMIFMMAATWPDEIKGLKNKPPPTNPVTGDPYVTDGSIGGDRPEGSPNPTANTGYSDDSMHKYWHFVDTPFSTDGTPLTTIPTPNAEERITLFRGVLASTTATDDLKSYDLSWLLHLVGDVHQPLHCTTRVSASNTNGDSGGNDVDVLKPKEVLHAFWDDVLGTGTDSNIVSKVITAANALPSADATLASETDAKDWVKESFQLAQSDVYVSPIGSGAGPFTLTTTYKKNAKTLAQKQIALAGARLANLLNNELK